MNWRDYIISDSEILLGKPCIKGTRICVELLLELLSNGWSEDKILEAYPTVTSGAMKAVFSYLKDCIKQELYFPISA